MSSSYVRVRDYGKRQLINDTIEYIQYCIW